jgi:hypothetical protein
MSANTPAICLHAAISLHRFVGWAIVVHGNVVIIATFFVTCAGW